MKDILLTLIICYITFVGLKIVYDMLKHKEQQKSKKQYYSQTGKRLK